MVPSRDSVLYDDGKSIDLPNPDVDLHTRSDGGASLDQRQKGVKLAEIR